MQKLSREEKNTVMLFVGCWIVYLLTMFSKSNYTAAVAYIVSRGIFTKSGAGHIASCFYILYGICQFFGGWLADRWSPYKIITIGIAGAFAANAAIAFTTNYTAELIIWSINAILQCGIWPGMSKIISERLMPEFRKKASVYIIYGSPIGSLLSYLCSVLLLERFGWGVMFGTSAATLFVALVIWKIIEKKYSAKVLPTESRVQSANSTKAKKLLPLLISSGLLLMLIPSMGRSLLNNGLHVWVPTMIMESYTVSSGFASIQSILLLIIQIAGLAIITPFLSKVKKPMMLQLIFSIVVVVPVIVLQFIGSIPIVLVIAMLALVTMIMNVLSMLMTQVVVQFGKTGYSGTYSGLSNAMSSFGVVVASGGFGILAEKMGWSAVTFSWIIMAVAMLICTVPALVLWRKFIKTL